MSFSFNKLRTYLPGQNHNGNSEEASKRHSVSLEPEIGFQISLGTCESSASNSNGNENQKKIKVPELNVNLIGARHLPSTFGFKVVQGYDIKVKLFPGTRKYDSKIQTNTWPKFNEHFKFPLGSGMKSSLKRYGREPTTDSELLPENVLAGHFIVFTVYAHLELPSSMSFNRFNKTYRSLKDKMGKMVDSNGNSSNPKEERDLKKIKRRDSTEDGEQVPTMTKSEAKRNLGSVTCYLEPKIFKKNNRSGTFCTEEMWLPIKDITTTIVPVNKNAVMSANKGQIELVLEFCDNIVLETNSDPSGGSPTNGNSPHAIEWSPSKSLKSQWSLNDFKKILKNDKKSSLQDCALKVTTTKMRCSIKVKDEFENIASTIYVKTAVFENEVLMNSWKSDHMLPSISTRWDTDDSTIIIPLSTLDRVENMSIKISVATKTKVGKKIVLGSLIVRPHLEGKVGEHWSEALTNRNKPIAMWHNFQ